MSRSLLIYANHEVALRYRQLMDRHALSSVVVAVAIWATSLTPYVHRIGVYILAVMFLGLGALSFWSRNSMLKDVDSGLIVFKFTPEGWYRNESPALHRWDDFKRVRFADRSITFFEAKQLDLHSAEISPMLMTDSDFDRVDSWIRQHIPAHMKP